MNLWNIFNHGLRILINLAIFSTLVISCRTTQTAVDSKDLSYLYNPAKTFISPQYKILNESEDRSVLSVKFLPSDLFFSEANPEGVPLAQILMSVKVYNISGGRLIADTAAFNLRIRKEESKSEYTYHVPLRVENGNEYVAEVKILDRLRQIVVQAFVPFNTLSYNSRYYFSAVEHFNKNPLYNPVLKTDDYVNLIYRAFPIDSLYITYYQPLKNVPYPPSMILPEKTIDYDPDTVVAITYSDTLPVMLPKPGVYFFSLGRELTDGYTLYNFGDEFPHSTSPETMTEPLAYIATDEEMAALRSSPKPKVALDDFWIKIGGNVEKARELIRIYYTRVLYSNYYFTSFKEGWRTERGMIYIIYGPPDKVYKSPEGEQWGYRKPVIRSSWGGRYHLRENYIFFNFRNRKSMFSDNDFYISRGETLVTQWDQAVASWRKGIVFRLDNPDDF